MHRVQSNERHLLLAKNVDFNEAVGLHYSGCSRVERYPFPPSGKMATIVLLISLTFLIATYMITLKVLGSCRKMHRDGAHGTKV